MSRKSTQPALYERMRSRPAMSSQVSPSRPLASDAAQSPGAAESWLTNLFTPGRTIRLPVGYLMLAGGLAILVLAVAYMIGHNSGERSEREKYEESVRQGLGPPVSDPLNTEPLVPPGGGAGALLSGAGSQGGTAAPPAGSGQWGVVEPASNPRREGFRYFVLMETTADGARRFAEFCRANGLETYVIPSKNERRRRVVVFPGFEASDKQGRAAIEARIERINDLWKKADRNNRDLRGYYPIDHND